MGKYWEEFSVGERFLTPRRTITEGAISVMLGLGGYVLPLFLDEEYAKTTIFGGRICPGPLTLFLMAGLEEQVPIFDETLIAAVGINNIKLKAPLRAGDSIKAEMEITGKRETSKPDRGIINLKATCINQREEAILEADFTYLFKRKGAA